jgi:Dyp-type peroxidase family
MVIRASTINTPSWDQQPLGTQETAIGRFKVSGAALDLADEPENLNLDPLFATQAASVVVPVASHIRKANPRRDAEDASRRIFRRGYPLLGALGSLSTGLVFICFGRSISTQFEFVFRAWMRNADFPTQEAGVDHLLAFESGVIAGGYYFAPSLKEANKAWTWSLPV